MEHQLLCFYRARLIFILGGTLFPAFTLLDYFAAPQFYYPFLLARLLIGLAGLILLVGFRIFPIPFQKIASLAAFLFVLTMQLIICFMCYRLGGFSSSYYAGLIVVILGTTLVIPWHPAYTVSLNLLTYAGYLSQALPFGLNASPATLAAHHSFLACSFFLTIIGSALQYRLYLRLSALNQLKGQLMSMASHDLRGPLNVVLHCFELLRNSTTASVEEKRSLIQLGKRNVDRMLSLVRGLLDLNQIEAGRMNLEKKNFNLLEIVENITELLLPIVREKRVSLSLPSKDPPVFLKLDAAKVGQVFDNLLRNAIRHTPFGGKVFVEIEDLPSETRCHIRDTGEGIDPQVAQRLFDQFAKFGDTGGLGLGLFISKKIVEMHGGRIWVDSARGNGARFSFTFPKEG